MELKKRKEWMSLLTVSISRMSPQKRAAHNFYKGIILDNIEAKMVTAEAAAATLPLEAEPAPAGASASASTPVSVALTSASASASASATEQTTPDRARPVFNIIAGPVI
jgi:hypothetical protein